MTDVPPLPPPPELNQDEEFEHIMKEFERRFPEWDWRGYKAYKHMQKIHEIDDDLLDSEEKENEIDRLLKRWSPGNKKR